MNAAPAGAGEPEPRAQAHGRGALTSRGGSARRRVAGSAARRGASWADEVWFGLVGRWWREAGREVSQALYPADCVGCGAGGGLLCALCREELGAALLVPQVVDDLAELDVLAPRSAAPIVSAGRYGGITAAVILEAKRAHGFVLLPPLGAALHRVLAGLPAGVLLVPVPASRAGTRRRGFVPVEELLRLAGRGTAVRWARILRPRRRLPQGLAGLGTLHALSSLNTLVSLGGGAAQKGRDRRARANAVRGAFGLRRGAKLRGRDVVLVDDVMTSGATLAECARVLRRGGARVVGAAVVSHVPDPHAASADG
ncbi:ComF family protein [Galactobacter caseinivorans]|uniref:ComF family protein n=1 Tax=Galactobacter caseinivorans TaxID=2676123 RepID=A0A496PMJ4_9MICC|nr:phosphoribosyltransferase family protein [Galactobacter caseinivorans]RKW71644.1 ComF family protein [Galactobacter caseinivorans]